jgi:hypothetical protein
MTHSVIRQRQLTQCERNIRPSRPWRAPCLWRAPGKLIDEGVLKLPAPDKKMKEINPKSNGHGDDT